MALVCSDFMSFPANLFEEEQPSTRETESTATTSVGDISGKRNTHNCFYL